MAKTIPAYIPLARKYRPKNFAHLVGQDVLTKTLNYCIINNKLAGAILLTGIRGVGKTSSARIIAKTVNCTSLITDEASNLLPCETCNNCEGFNKNNHPDFIEVDAASKTSVDDVKRIIEMSEYRPLIGKYKIFIIDEVHMFSKSAFNALLKRIEEPPPHAIFIFATTEAQKIPLTVLSRCQRYDLRRLSYKEVFLLLENIAKKEKLKFEEEALKIIALKSEGSARDGVMLLDQASSFQNTSETQHITAGSINKMLGLVQISIILKLVKFIINSNPKDALNLLEEVYASSSSIEYFLQQISDFIANLIQEKVVEGYSNPLYKNYSTEITDIVIGTSLSRLSVLWQIFNDGTNEIKAAHDELITSKMLIIKAIYSCDLPEIEDILDPFVEIPDISLTENTGKPKNLELQTPVETEANNIFSFLKFCHTHKELELYYFLLNEIEVKNFVEPVMEIATNANIIKEENIKSMLDKWSGKKWKIIVQKQEKIKSLKEILIEKTKNSEDFMIVKNKFPEADISDIILKS